MSDSPGVVEPSTIYRIAYHNFCGTDIAIEAPVEPLVDALYKILTDFSYWNTLSNFGVMYARTELDARIGAEQLDRIYRELIRNGHGSLSFRAKAAVQTMLAMAQIYGGKMIRRVEKLVSTDGGS